MSLTTHVLRDSFTMRQITKQLWQPSKFCVARTSLRGWSHSRHILIFQSGNCRLHMNWWYRPLTVLIFRRSRTSTCQNIHLGRRMMYPCELRMAESRTDWIGNALLPLRVCNEVMACDGVPKSWLSFTTPEMGPSFPLDLQGPAMLKWLRGKAEVCS